LKKLEEIMKRKKKRNSLREGLEMSGQYGGGGGRVGTSRGEHLVMEAVLIKTIAKV